MGVPGPAVPDDSEQSIMDDPNVCPKPERMGKFACKNRSQCWEPCGDLGHDPRHAVTDAQERMLKNFDAAESCGPICGASVCEA